MTEQFYGVTETRRNSVETPSFVHVQPWIVEGDSAYRYTPSEFLRAPESLNGKRFEDWISKSVALQPHNEISETVTYGVAAQIPFGHFFPRVYRPIASKPPDYRLPENARALAHLDVQLELFSDMIKGILRNIEPIDAHMSVFGHEIRNLLLLASTEVEAQWKAILKANGYVFQGDARGVERATTSDYVKLLPLLRLGEYASCLPYTPDLVPRAPFAAWDAARPTQSLAWYSAYNAVKHDRESQFFQARLEHAVDAVLACEILRKAQFFVPPLFEHVSQPRWKGEDYYVVGLGGTNGKEELPWASAFSTF